MDADLEKLRNEIAVSRDSRGRVPRELRRRVVDVLEGLKEIGRPYHQLANEVGVSVHTLMTWRGRGRAQRIEPVEVKVPVAERGMVVHGPRGMRVEGLTVAELAELWARLG